MSSPIVLAVDPGTFESAFVLLEQDAVWDFGKVKNLELLQAIEDQRFNADVLALEMLDARGSPMGYETLRTLVWCGQFRQAFGRDLTKEIKRSEVKSTICGQHKDAKDANIRQAMIDRWGGDSVAVGGVKCGTCKGKGWTGRDHASCSGCNGSLWKFPPGPLNGFSKDCWQALAVGVTYYEKHCPIEST